MNKVIVFFLFTFLCGGFVYAQNISIQGVVSNAETKEVLIGANIQILETKEVTVTNRNGHFVFENLSAGDYTVVVSYIGFETQKKIIQLKNHKVNLDFKLQKSSTSLDELVVTGTGTTHHIRTAPIMTEVIGKKFLSMYSGQSLEDIFSGLSPSFDFNENIMGSNIQMNGLGNKYILILLNGERIHGDVGGQNLLGLVNPSDIEKVEIVKGASSSLYGSDAIAGVINVITKKSTAKIELQNNTRFASYNVIQQKNSIALSKGKWHSTTKFNLKHSDGWQNTKKEWYRRRIFDNSVSKTVNEFTDYKIIQKIAFKPNKKFSTNLEGSFYQKGIKRPTGVPQYVTYNMSYKSHSYAARAKYRLNDNTLFTFNTNYSKTRYFHDFTHITEEEHVLEDGTIIHPIYYPDEQFEVNNQERWLAHLKSVFSLTPKQTISAGIEYQKDGLTSPYRLLSQKESDFFFAGYVQDEYNISKTINLTGGVRLIQHEVFGMHVTPKISAMKTWKNFNFRATWSKGFKTPTIKELHYHYERTMMAKLRLYLGNENLNPETSNYYSVAVEYNRKKLSFNVTAYHNNLKDMITLMEVPTSYDDRIRGVDKTMQYQNIEDAKINGIEVTAKYKPISELNIGGGYSYTDANGHFINDDNEIEAMIINGTAHHRANVYALWNHTWEKYALGIGFFIKGQTKRYYRTYGDADGYVTCRMNTQHKLLSLSKYNVEINTGIDNIFDYKEDKPYGYNYATKTPGRTFYISLIINYKKQ